MVHCDKRGSELMAGSWSHVVCQEQCHASSLANVHIHNVPQNEDGTFSIEYVEKKCSGPSMFVPTTQLVMIENTHCMAGQQLQLLKFIFELTFDCSTGGKVLPLEWIEKLSKVCKDKNLRLHMDGARMFSAAAYLNVPISRIVRDVDSVSFCFSKNLCCPVGTMFVGRREYVQKARIFRKALGGGMRQSGFLASAAIYALDNIAQQLKFDHERIRKIGIAIDSLKSKLFRVDVENIHTNIMMIYIADNDKNITTATLIERLKTVKSDELKNKICDESGKGIIVKASCRDNQTLRFVTYHQVTDDLVELAITKVLYVLKELEN
jgi:threonine aldolase